MTKNNPLKIGVTGGIGSGKSYVCNLLRRQGYPVFDCDSEAKHLMLSSPDVRHRLQVLVPDAYLPDGTLNKCAIAAYLFADATHAARINAVVHPAVADAFDRWSCEQDAPVVFMECAILYEAHFDTRVDKVLLVDAPESLRLQRATVRDGATPEQIQARMAHQYPVEELRKRAHYTLQNNAESDVEAQIHVFLRTLSL
jgi:dephospho-CoA kinase